VERTFVELSQFQIDWKTLGQTDEELRILQNYLAKQPEAGWLIQGTGGLRKVRWGREGKQSGKRGGVRVIYLDVPAHGRMYLLAVFGKDEKDDLSEGEKRQLKFLSKRLLSF
jgi:hypothetical protein